MSVWKAKRFWKEARVVEEGGGFSVFLDGRPVKTPAKNQLVLPSRALAEAVAAEWDAQDGDIQPLTMPFTRTANAAIDKVVLQFSEVADMLADYGDSDLLCYRASGPQALVDLQSVKWDPILKWAEERLGARLEPRVGVMHVPQDNAALERLAAKVHGFSAFELAALHELVSLSGSLILGFACAHDLHSATEIWEISRLDEIWQAEQWGRDDEAEAAAEVKRAAFLHAKQVFDLSNL